MKTRKIISLCLVLVLVLAAASAVMPQAASALVAGCNSPAICADAGEKIDLTKVSVQFENEAKSIPGNAVEWQYKGAKLTEFTPAQKGVYPFTATYGDKTKNVYVVAKNLSESEYVLYANDFSSDPIPDLKVVQKTSGCVISYDSNEKALVLNGSDASDGYIRVLLPEWLSDFGDSVMTSEFKITRPKADSRWASMMFRVQNINYPYLQVAMRYGTSASNGLEIAERNSGDAWNVITKTGITALGDAYRTVVADVAGQSVKYYVNGTQYLSINNAPYDRGAFGFQVRGVTMTVKSVKICVNPNAVVVDGMPGGLRETRKLSSNVVAAPDLIREIESADELAAIGDKTPAVAIMDVKKSGNDVKVCGLDANEAMARLPDNVIPGFKINDAAALDATVKCLNGLGITDAFFVSSDTAILSEARSKIPDSYNAYDVPAGIKKSVEQLRKEANACGASVLILPEGLNSREDISYVQDRYFCVWERTDGTDAANVSAINRGVLGLINDSTAQTEAALTKYYLKGTVSRYTNIIGHRGVPSLAQENSLASCITAFEKGASMVENDTYLMTDGVIIIMHDSTIDRTTDGTGSVADFNLESIRKYYININENVPKEPIPTLEEYFKQFKGNGKAIVIEYKQNDVRLAEPMAKLIKQYEMEDQVVVISFNRNMLLAMQYYLPGVSTGFLDNKLSIDDANALRSASAIIPAVRGSATMFSPSYQKGALGDNLVSVLQARGITTWIWTVNTQADFDKYFCAGIRGLTTNYCQWAQYYVKELSVVTEDGKTLVKAEQYGGRKNDVSDSVKLVVVDDGGTGLSYDKTTFTLNGNPGTAKYFFSYSATTGSGTRYTKVTDLMTLEIPGAAEESSAAETSEGSPVSTQEATSAEETSAQVPASKGCGSAVSIGAAIAVILCAAIHFRKKNNYANY